MAESIPVRKFLRDMLIKSEQELILQYIHAYFNRRILNQTGELLTVVTSENVRATTP